MHARRSTGRGAPLSAVLMRKLQLLAVLCVFMGGVATLFNMVSELPSTTVAVHAEEHAVAGGAPTPHQHVQRTDSDDLPPFAVGAVLGLAFGVLELFVLEAWGRRLRSLAFGPLVLAKAVLYTFVVFVAIETLAFVTGYIAGKSVSEFWESMVSALTWTIILVTLASYALMAFFVQVNRMVGQDVMMKFLRGRYMRPTEEDRVFMFLDLKGSTTIAERLGPRYYQLLDDFFHDISRPVMMAGAEIYLYVGDEVVLTWELDRGLRDANCIRVYALINTAVTARADEYRQKYGVAPEYKAGVHCGPVISAQIGDIKREIVYNGDVVNTTSRIQEMCGGLDVDLLVSGDVMRRLDLPAAYAVDELGPTPIRGKEQQVELFSVRPA
jgi:adenylate cyclase